MTQSYRIKFTFLVITILGALFMEMGGFILVGKEIGILATLGLTLLTMILGSILLAIQGMSLLNNTQYELTQRHVPENDTNKAASILIGVTGAILLILPGFISDILGILLFIKPLRSSAWTLFLCCTRRSSISTIIDPKVQNESGKTIELNATDYYRCNASHPPPYNDNCDHEA